MSLLSSLFRSKKPNLTPDVPYHMPASINPNQYNSLQDLSLKFQRGEGTGFGEDFVDKTTNPVANSMRRNFEQFTSPKISSNYSARGLGRSSLAANEQGRAQGDVEANIGNLMAQNYYLNQMQKKQDQQFGANLGQNILQGDVSRQGEIAAASEQLAGKTAEDARHRESRNATNAGKWIGTAMNAIVPGSGMAFTGQQTYQPTQPTASPNLGSTKAPVLGGQSTFEELEAYLKQLGLI